MLFKYVKQSNDNNHNNPRYCFDISKNYDFITATLEQNTTNSKFELSWSVREFWCISIEQIMQNETMLMSYKFHDENLGKVIGDIIVNPNIDCGLRDSFYIRKFGEESPSIELKRTLFCTNVMQLLFEKYSNYSKIIYGHVTLDDMVKSEKPSIIDDISEIYLLEKLGKSIEFIFDVRLFDYLLTIGIIQ